MARRRVRCGAGVEVSGADKGAVLSPCGTYRYHLWRKIELGVTERGRRLSGRVAFVMLNPSTADAEQDDPTIRKCIGYARRWGYEWLDVVNLFAFRATDPKELYADEHRFRLVGDDNQRHLSAVCGAASLVVCAWGKHGGHLNRGKSVRYHFGEAGVKLHHLKLNGDGSPAHPLYLKGDLQPTEWLP